MKSTTIEQREVNEAIIKLLAKGQYPTAANVRAMIGGRGSPPVLSRMMSSWYQENGPTLIAGEASQHRLQVASTEQSIREKLKAATAEAMATFEQEIEAREQALAARIHEQEQLEKMLKERELKLEGRENMAAECVQSANLRVSEALSGRDQALQQLVNEKKNSTQLKTELEGLQQQLSMATSQAEELTQQLEAAMTDNRTWGQKHGYLTGQYKAAKEKEVELLEMLEKEKNTTLKIRDELVSIQTQFAAIKGAAEEERKQHQATGAKIEDLQVEVIHLTDKNARLESKIAEQTKELVRLTQAHQQEIAQRDSTIQTLSDLRILSTANDRLDVALSKLTTWAEQIDTSMQALWNELKSETGT